MNSNPQSKQVARDLIAWVNGDVSKAGAVSESVDVYNPGLPDGEVHSRDDWEAYQNSIKEAFPDFHVEIKELVASGNVAMAEVRITGTHKETFKGIPATGREVEIWGIEKFVIEDGRVEDWYAYYDTQELQAQLGMTFPDVIGQLPRLAWRKIQASV